MKQLLEKVESVTEKPISFKERCTDEFMKICNDDILSGNQVINEVLTEEFYKRLNEEFNNLYADKAALEKNKGCHVTVQIDWGSEADNDVCDLHTFPNNTQTKIEMMIKSDEEIEA